MDATLDYAAQAGTSPPSEDLERKEREMAARIGEHETTIDGGWREVADTALAFVKLFL
jgi:hypothetical protein